MAVWGFYVDSYWVYSENETASYTDDFNFSPNNVYATAMLTGVLVANNSFLFSGILEYQKRDPNTGQEQVVPVGTTNESFGLAEVIIDNNVDRVTFALAVWDTGGGDFGARADAVHQVWFYD
ncbi:MAG TPA: hypothetical protein VFB24_01440 [Candidatus Binatia bacterium]|nr:hypothetical protein [Candidatus Binatia bacterium]